MLAGEAIQRVLRRERWVVLGALGLLVALSWTYLLAGGGTGMNALSMTTAAFPPYSDHPVGAFAHQPWSAGYWLTMLLMWWVMMIAMMTPSAAPVILLHATLVARARGDVEAGTPTAVVRFAAGYLSIWLLFALAATALEWLLERAGLVSAMWMWSENSTLTGAILVLAGLYQLTPLKSACLESCRSPIAFLMQHWRAGAFRMGLVHGAYCLGCCWALMLLLFAGGVMNLLWIAGLSIFVLIEKLLGFGRLFGQLSGVAFLVLGLVIMMRPEWL
jgi:predicted metal-binding membrane protein